jgi:hypothetical protein
MLGKINDMNINPIAIFHSPLSSKFGIPRQSGLANELKGYIVFESKYRNPDALRGLEEIDYIWLLWEFSANKRGKAIAGEIPANEITMDWQPTVRPPRLGGNKSITYLPDTRSKSELNLDTSLTKLFTLSIVLRLIFTVFMVVTFPSLDNVFPLFVISDEKGNIMFPFSFFSSDTYMIHSVMKTVNVQTCQIYIRFYRFS